MSAFNFREKLNQVLEAKAEQVTRNAEREENAKKLEVERKVTEQQAAVQKRLNALVRKHEVYERWHALDLGKLLAAQEAILELPIETAGFLREHKAPMNVESFPAPRGYRGTFSRQTGRLWGYYSAWQVETGHGKLEYDNSDHSVSLNIPKAWRVNGWGINKKGDEFEIHLDGGSIVVTSVKPQYARTDEGAWVTQPLDAPDVDIAQRTLNEIGMTMGYQRDGSTERVQRYPSLDMYIAAQLDTAAKPYIRLTEQLVPVKS